LPPDVRAFKGHAAFHRVPAELGVLTAAPLAFAPGRTQHESDKAEHAVEQVIHLLRTLQLFLRRLEMANLQLVADRCEFSSLVLKNTRN
jgi:hypothetical protein